MLKLPKKSALVWLWLSVVVIILDQLGKFLVLHNLNYQEALRLTSFLNFTLTYNPGAAFSFLDSAGGWQIYVFVAISLVVAVIFILWLRQTPRTFFWRALGLSLIIGGAIGNCIDRLRLTYVVDFIDFHVRGWHFATFNVADSAVCIGAFCLIFSMFYIPRR